LAKTDNSSCAKRHVYSEHCKYENEEARKVSEFVLCEQQRQYEYRRYNERAK
jgi:hypothetical protein